MFDGHWWQGHTRCIVSHHLLRCTVYYKLLRSPVCIVRVYTYKTRWRVLLRAGPAEVCPFSPLPFIACAQTPTKLFCYCSLFLSLPLSLFLSLSLSISLSLSLCIHKCKKLIDKSCLFTELKLWLRIYTCQKLYSKWGCKTWPRS